MEDMTDFRRQLSSRRPSDWEHLPDFPLYMDQVLSYMERQTVRLDEDDALTASMVNNYAKNALLPRAEGKKYNREHLAYHVYLHSQAGDVRSGHGPAHPRRAEG